MAGSMPQVVKQVPGKYKTLNSNSSTTKRKRKEARINKLYYFIREILLKTSFFSFSTVMTTMTTLHFGATASNSIEMLNVLLTLAFLHHCKCHTTCNVTMRIL
jgi:hypothetical protein